MWPFLYSEDGESDEVDKIPMSTLFRWFLYDMDVENHNQFAEIFKLTAVSEEGDEKEREESDRRTERLAPLYSFLSLYASMNAQYTYEVFKDDMSSMESMSGLSLEKESEVLKLFFRNVSFAAIMGTFSTALELGLIKLNGTFTGIE